MESITRIAPASPLEPVAKVNPVAPYIGGKKNLSKHLVERINAIDHTIYAECFVGMGGVFLRRTMRPRVEVINDWSEDVSTFFRILQRHYVAFLDMLRFQVSSRAGFERLKRTDPSTLTDLERAARFLYLQRLAFGGQVAKRNFGIDSGRASRFDMTKLGPMLESLHERLAGVTIERLPWQDFIRRYDRPGTLFYLDPPYYQCEGDYGAGLFTRDQFAEMADQLRGLKGRFLMSINDHPDIRQTFAGFDMEEVRCRYTVGGSGCAKDAGELIISN